MKTLLKSLVLATSLIGSIASADILKFDADLSPYDPNLKLDVQIPTFRHNSGVSGATFIANGTYKFEAFCIELDQDPWETHPYDRTVMLMSDPRYANYAKLYENWYGVAKASAVGTAAFATAIWEIQYDSANGPLDYSGGTFIVNAGPASVLALLSQMLTSVNSPKTPVPQGWEFVTWGNPFDQDLLEGRRVAIVPVPGTLAVTLLGLFALVGANGRRLLKRASWK
jgi:hypothetical protein